jgi:hypothetical protein
MRDFIECKIPNVELVKTTSPGTKIYIKRKLFNSGFDLSKEIIYRHDIKEDCMVYRQYINKKSEMKTYIGIIILSLCMTIIGLALYGLNAISGACLIWMWFICLMYSLIEANKELQKYNKRSE